MPIFSDVEHHMETHSFQLIFCRSLSFPQVLMPPSVLGRFSQKPRRLTACLPVQQLRNLPGWWHQSGVHSSRTCPLDTLPQGNGPPGFQTPKPAGSSVIIIIIIVEGALLSEPALQPGLQGHWIFLLGLGAPSDSWSGDPMTMLLAWFPSWYCQKAVVSLGPQCSVSLAVSGNLEDVLCIKN